MSSRKPKSKPEQWITAASCLPEEGVRQLTSDVFHGSGLRREGLNLVSHQSPAVGHLAGVQPFGAKLVH